MSGWRIVSRISISAWSISWIKPHWRVVIKRNSLSVDDYIYIYKYIHTHTHTYIYIYIYTGYFKRILRLKQYYYSMIILDNHSCFCCFYDSISWDRKITGLFIDCLRFMAHQHLKVIYSQNSFMHIYIKYNLETHFVDNILKLARAHFFAYS